MTSTVTNNIFLIAKIGFAIRVNPHTLLKMVKTSFSLDTCSEFSFPKITDYSKPEKCHVLYRGCYR